MRKIQDTKELQVGCRYRRFIYHGTCHKEASLILINSIRDGMLEARVEFGGTGYNIRLKLSDFGIPFRGNLKANYLELVY